MDVKQIQYFSLVSSTGSFNAAAKQLYISVPGLVKAMDRLENELGVQLFVRRRSGVTLTPAGQALARYAPRYIRKYEMIVSNVRKAAAQREMRAEVCMTWGMLSFFPRNFLSRFVLSNPDMSLSTHNYSLQELEEALNEYLEALKVVDYWTGKVRELNGAFIYRSPSSNTELPTKAIGNPTVSVSMEMETAEENEREARQYAKEAKRRVLSLIQMARTADQKVLLMRRYIDGMSWEDAAEAAGKSRTWATNTHGEALLYIRLPDAVKKQ